MKPTNNQFAFGQLGLIATILLLLTACGGLKPIQHSNYELPEAFTGRSESTGSLEIVERGDFFKDEHLLGLIEEALRNNQELKIVTQEIAIANAEIKGRKGEYLPFIGLAASLDSEKVGRFTRNGAVEHELTLDGEEFPEPLKNQSVGLTASWELDVWKKLRNQKKAAFHEYMASWEAQRFMTSQLVSEIASTYYELVTLDLTLKNIERYNDLQKNALKIVKLLKQAGKSNELAVKRFEAEYDRNQSEVIRVRQEIIGLENEIRFLVGNPTLEISRTDQFVSSPLLFETDEIPVNLVLNRPDLKQAMQELEASKLMSKAARASFLPSIGINSSYGREAFKAHLLGSTPESVFYRIAGELLSPLFNFNELKAQLAIANAHQEQAYLEYQKTSLKAFLEVSTQLWNVENLKEQLALQKDQVTALEQANTISNVLFKAARADYLEVLLTQRESLEAQNQWLDSQKQLINANIALYKAIGGGWF